MRGTQCLRNSLWYPPVSEEFVHRSLLPGHPRPAAVTGRDDVGHGAHEVGKEGRAWVVWGGELVDSIECGMMCGDELIYFRKWTGVCQCSGTKAMMQQIQTDTPQNSRFTPTTALTTDLR